MFDIHRDRFQWLEKWTANVFTKLPLTPNQVTVISIFFALASAYYLYIGDILMGLIMLIISGYLDLVDGAIARAKGLASKTGAYIDTITDRYVEIILLIGMSFLPFDTVIFPSYIWIILAISGSLMTTYAKAAAKEKDLVSQELKGGLLSRGERILSYWIILILCFQNFWAAASYLLAGVAIFANFTAGQRIFNALSAQQSPGTR
ncbi:MAG TPA: CDP-alcohol phosphatidyltransferase family protein [Candidatus Pacearchaeota archaeon]|nr:CDP-alcohol phosphatidyltransferase family protein [Candidatus Pacearchaeota archaeon]